MRWQAGGGLALTCSIPTALILLRSTQGTQGNNAFGFNLSSMLARYAAAKLDDM